MKNLYGDKIDIEVVVGGFILSYPVITLDLKGEEVRQYAREVFPNVHSLNKKLKEIINALSLVPMKKSAKKEENLEVQMGL